MICNQISVRQFRNIKSATVDFGDGVNVLYGHNAEGKTNLLEAIYYIAIGKSFRGAKNTELTTFGGSFSDISLDFTDDVRRQNITMYIKEGRLNSATKNGCRAESLASLLGSFRAVMFCPEHLLLVKEGPLLRRNYLDVALCQLKPMYLRSLQRYNRTLKQRNTLLKHAEEDRRTFESTIDFWSGELAREGAYIAKARAEYVKMLDENAKLYFNDMTKGNETPSFHYVGTAHREEDDYLDTEIIEQSFLDLLSKQHDREIGAGTTLWGIHRDDVSIDLNDKPARIYASQGQQRSLSLAMKLSEGEISRKLTTEYPVFLFDDVLSELDEKRRAYLLSEISGKQVIMTSCEKVSADNARIIRVKNGTYEEER